MKRKVLLFLSILMLCGCSNISKKKYIKIDYSELCEMTDNYSSFSLVIEQDNCYSCKQFKSILKEYLKDGNKIVYYINYTDLQSVDKLSLSSRVYSLFGSSYYEANNIEVNTLNTPTIIRFTNGFMDNGSVGVMDLDSLKILLDSDLLELQDYFGYTRKTAADQTFNIVFTTSFTRDDLNTYMTNNSYQRLYYVNLSNLTENNKTSLLNRINYFLEEDISELNDNFLLKYNLGSISEYINL